MMGMTLIMCLRYCRRTTFLVGKSTSLVSMSGLFATQNHVSNPAGINNPSLGFLFNFCACRNIFLKPIGIG